MSFYTAPWNNDLTTIPLDVNFFYLSAAFSRAIESIRHCGHKNVSALYAGLFSFFSGMSDWGGRIISSILIITRRTTKLSIFKKGIERLLAIETRSFEGNSFLPRFYRILSLSLSAQRSFKPFSRLCQLNSSLCQIKPSFLPVSFKVIRPTQHFKIFNFIITLISIDVMDVHPLRNRSVMVNPDPSMSVNRHSIGPISILLLPKNFTKIFSNLSFSHALSNVKYWLVRLAEIKIFKEQKAT